LARLYQSSKNYERALENYQQSLLLAPDRPENYLHSAGMQLELKKYDDAIATLTEARHRFRIPQITYSLAIALSTASRHSQAMPVYEAALQEAKDSQQEILDAAFYFNYGVCAEQGGFIDKAAALLQGFQLYRLHVGGSKYEPGRRRQHDPKSVGARAEQRRLYR
jgi:tetratricopeptide (TPR) repeat protein